MTEPIPLFALAKVLIAAAWADGNLSPDEVISVKHLLLRVRNLTALQWQTLEIYLDSPVEEAERIRLIDELRAATHTPEQRQAIFDCLDDVIRADGSVSPQEEHALAEVKASLAQGAQGDKGFFSGLSQLMGKSKQKPPPATANNREIYLEDYVKNRVYYRVERRTGGNQLNIPDSELRRLCLVAALVARVAIVHENVSDAEFQAIVDSLQNTWGANRDAATLIAEIATTEPLGEMEYRMETEMLRLFTYEERVQLLDVLFGIAMADGSVSPVEFDKIRAISNIMRVSHQDYIDAKKKVPADKRST